MKVSNPPSGGSDSKELEEYTVTFTIDELQLLIAPYVKPKHQEKLKAGIIAYTNRKVIEELKYLKNDIGFGEYSWSESTTRIDTIIDKLKREAGE
jgi:hypothetical protein